MTCHALPKVTRALGAKKSCHKADSVQTVMSIGLLRRNRMSDDEKFKNFAKYRLDYEQSERNAVLRKWVLVVIVAGTSIGLTYLLSS